MDPLLDSQEVVSRQIRLRHILDSVDLTLPAGYPCAGWSIFAPLAFPITRRPYCFVWVVHAIKYCQLMLPHLDWTVIDDWTCGQVFRAFRDYNIFRSRARRASAFRSLFSYSCPDLLWLCMHLATTLNVPNRPKVPTGLSEQLSPSFSVKLVYVRFLRKFPPVIYADGLPVRSGVDPDEPVTKLPRSRKRSRRRVGSRGQSSSALVSSSLPTSCHRATVSVSMDPLQPSSPAATTTDNSGPSSS